MEVVSEVKNINVVVAVRSGHHGPAFEQAFEKLRALTG